MSRQSFAVTGINNSSKQASVNWANGVAEALYSAPINVKEYGAVGNGTTDDTAAIQAALDYANTVAGASASTGGCTVYLPTGTYLISSALRVYAETTLRGDGRVASWIKSAHAGSGSGETGARSGSTLYSQFTINGSTAANIRIEHLGIENTSASNLGAGYYDQAGTYIVLHDVEVRGHKFGAILDQSELADIDLCNFASQLTGGVWMVNGADLNASASGMFTNRISVTRCQINQGTGAYGIIDDGGYVHSFVDNNYNGCLNHIRAAGVEGLRISGGEFESASSHNIRFESTRLSGGSVGSCVSVYIGDSPYIVPSAGNSCVFAISLSNITLNSVYFGNTTAAKFVGTSNVNAIYAQNAFNGGGGATFDGRATNHFEVGYDGTNFKIRTNLDIEHTGNKVVGARQAAIANHASDATVNAILTALRNHGLIAT